MKPRTEQHTTPTHDLLQYDQQQSPAREKQRRQQRHLHTTFFSVTTAAGPQHDAPTTISSTYDARDTTHTIERRRRQPLVPLFFIVCHFSLLSIVFSSCLLIVGRLGVNKLCDVIIFTTHLMLFYCYCFLCTLIAMFMV